MGSPILTLIIEILLCLWLYDAWQAARSPKHQEPPQMVVLDGHAGGVTSISFSSDGRTLATTGTDGSVKFWDPATGALLQTASNKDRIYTSVAYSENGEGLVSATPSGSVSLWIADTRIRLLDMPPGKGEEDLDDEEVARAALAISSDGHRVWTGGPDSKIRFWDKVSSLQPRTAEVPLEVPSDQLLALARKLYPKQRDLAKYLPGVREGQKGIECLALSPDGRWLAVGTRVGTVEIRDPIWLKRLRVLGKPQVSDHVVRSIAFSPDGRLLAVAATAGPLRLWDAASGTLAREISTGKTTLAALSFTPDGRRLVGAGEDGTLQAWDPHSGGLVVQLNMPSRVPGAHPTWQALAASRDGRWLAVAGADQDGHGLVQVHQGLGRDVKTTLRYHSRFIRSLQAAPGNHLMLLDQDGHAWLTDLATGREHRNLARGAAATLISPDGRLLASSAYHLVAGKLPQISLDLRNADQGASVHKWPLAGWPQALVFSPDSRRLAMGEPGGVRLLGLGPGWPVRRITYGGKAARPWENTPSHLAFSPDGAILAGADSNGTVRLWDAREGKPLGELNTGQPTDLVSRALEKLAARDSRVGGLAFSPDGRRLAISVVSTWERIASQVVQIWDVPAARLVLVLGMEGTGSRSIAFSPDGRLLAASSGAGKITVWDVAEGPWNAGRRVLSHLVTLDNGVTLAEAPQARKTADIEAAGGQVTALTFSGDSALLVAATDQGPVTFWRAADAWLLFRLVPMDQQEWVVTTPDGRFDASAGGAAQVAWQAGKQEVRLDRLPPHYRTPGLWPAMLRDPGLPPAAPDIRQGLPANQQAGIESRR